MKTIYNVYVPIESQEQADRMKQLCIDNGLSIWDYDCGWKYRIKNNCVFAMDICDNDFFVHSTNQYVDDFTKVTEQEFIELLKQTR